MCMNFQFLAGEPTSRVIPSPCRPWSLCPSAPKSTRIPIRNWLANCHHKFEKCCQKLTLQGCLNHRKLIPSQCFFALNSYTHSHVFTFLLSEIARSPKNKPNRWRVIQNWKGDPFPWSLGFHYTYLRITSKRDPETIETLKTHTHTHKKSVHKLR